ncbi:MAG TPA: LpqB family beta-propeller domain-containing protein [Micromonosporaceae bacterium]
MAETRRRVGLLALVVSVALLVAGCGVPTDRAPVFDGTGPGAAQGNKQGEQQPPGPDTRNPRELVERFLQAPAGKPDAPADKVRPFLTPDAARTWQPVPGNGIVVARHAIGAVTQDIPKIGWYTVELSLDVIGVLTDKGVLDPPGPGPYPCPKKQPCQLQLMPNDDDSALRIVNPPDGLLLSDAALETWYQPHAIYFWDTERRVLVPDLRYLPLASTWAQWQTVVDWLIAGPSDWLRPAVNALPDGTQVLGRVTMDDQNQHLVVNLNAKAATEEDRAKLVAQLRWSLRPQYTGPVELQIAGAKVQVDGWSSGYLDDNPARTARQSDVDRYAVIDGKVGPIDAPSTGDANAVLTSPDNSRVVSAAISRDRQVAALVRSAPNGRVSLEIGRASRDGGSAYQDTRLSARAMSRPVWFNGPNGRLLFVAADGVLYLCTVTASCRPATPDGVTGVSAVAVAPDARRLALVAGGKMYVAAIAHSNATVAVMSPRLVPTGLTAQTAVAWSEEDRLVVAGRDGETVLSEVTVDGGVRKLLPKLGTVTVTQLTAYVDDPSDGPALGSVMLQSTPARAYEVFNTMVLAIQAPQPKPAPSGGGEAPAPVVSAPFFPDY